MQKGSIFAECRAAETPQQVMEFLFESLHLNLRHPAPHVPVNLIKHGFPQRLLPDGTYLVGMGLAAWADCQECKRKYPETHQKIVSQLLCLGTEARKHKLDYFRSFNRSPPSA